MAAVRGLPLKGARGLLTSSTSEGQSARTGSPEAAAATPNRKVKGLEAKLARLAAGKGEAGGDAEGKGGGGEEEEEEYLPEGALAGALGPVMEDVVRGGGTKKQGQREETEGGGGGEGEEMEEDGENPDPEVLRRAKEEAAKATLFKGLRFFLGREVPLSWVHLVLASFGGQVGWEGEGSPFAEADVGVTHQVVDRPVAAGSRRAGREYVQPQWIFDSVNARVRLPVDLYGPGKALPVSTKRGLAGGGGGELGYNVRADML